MNSIILQKRVVNFRSYDDAAWYETLFHGHNWIWWSVGTYRARCKCAAAFRIHTTPLLGCRCAKVTAWAPLLLHSIYAWDQRNPCNCHISHWHDLCWPHLTVVAFPSPLYQTRCFRASRMLSLFIYSKKSCKCAVFVSKCKFFCACFLMNPKRNHLSDTVWNNGHCTVRYGIEWH